MAQPVGGSRCADAQLTEQWRTPDGTDHTRPLAFTYHHSTADAGTDYNVVVATSNAVSGGALTTGIVVNKTVTIALTDGSVYTAALDIVADFTPDEARGTTYYWQFRTRAHGTWGPWSAVRNYVVNQVPVNTKVWPT